MRGVSTDGQNVAAQVAALRRHGAGKVFRETASGGKTDRAQLRRLLDQLAAGDVLMVTRLDRLARSTRDLLNTLAAIAGKKAGFRSIADTWADTTTPHGRLMLTVLGGLAEFEKELIRSRTAEGREREGARGEARAQTEIDRAPEARGDPPARRERRAGARDRPQLQRSPQHDFAAYRLAWMKTLREGRQFMPLPVSSVEHKCVLCHRSRSVASFAQQSSISSCVQKSASLRSSA